MSQSPEPLPIICLAGPTGSGKSALALALARDLDAEIINADSRQVYADFPLLTAQPTADERAEIPHHLYGFLKPEQKISAGRWSGLALEIIRKVLARGRVPLVVGGSGLYFQALLRGMAQIPPIPAAIGQELGLRMERQGSQALYAELARRDPVYAARIHANDRQRILRALEVIAATGLAFSAWHEQAEQKPLCLGPLFVLDCSLDWLAPRLARRIEQMLAQGALNEAASAFKRCPNPKAPAFSGIGVSECLARNQGSLSQEELLRLWLLRTRAYAKRQRTWFRARREAIFVSAERQEEATGLLERARACWQELWGACKATTAAGYFSE